MKPRLPARVRSLATDGEVIESGAGSRFGKFTGPSAEAELVHKSFFILFLLLLAVAFGILLLRHDRSADTRRVDGILVLSAAATLSVGLARRLPVQNVLMSTALIAILSTAAAVAGLRTGIFFGSFAYSNRFGGFLLNSIPWPIPFLWIAAIVSSRGVARLVVRPWRKTNYYGFWVIGFTVAFVIALDLGVEPYAAAWQQYWVWRTQTSVPGWYGAPWRNFLGWSVVTLGIVVLATPWLLNKQPVEQPTDYHPLIVWSLINSYFATANALHGYWWAVTVSASLTFGAAVFAIRGGRC